jgi:hypothetical protein
MPGIKKILLPQMTKLGTDLAGDVEVVIDHQGDAGPASYGQNFFGQPQHLVAGGMLGAELEEIAAAITKLLRKNFGFTAMQIGGVHEGIKLALGQRFHAHNLRGIRRPREGNSCVPQKRPAMESVSTPAG